MTDRETRIDELLAAGYRTIGAGYFSKVLARDGDDHVVKVARKPDGYLAFARLCERSSNPHLPRVRVTHEAECWYECEIERLHAFESRDEADDWAWTMTSYIAQRGFRWNQSRWCRVDARERKLPRKLRKGLNKICWSVLHDWTLDLHGANVMCRADGTPVVTDPVSFKRGKAQDKARIHDERC